MKPETEKATETLKVTPTTHKKVMQLKLDKGYKSVDELIIKEIFKGK